MFKMCKLIAVLLFFSFFFWSHPNHGRGFTREWPRPLWYLQPEWLLYNEHKPLMDLSVFFLLRKECEIMKEICFAKKIIEEKEIIIKKSKFFSLKLLLSSLVQTLLNLTQFWWKISMNVWIFDERKKRFTLFLSCVIVKDWCFNVH